MTEVKAESESVEQEVKETNGNHASSQLPEEASTKPEEPSIKCEEPSLHDKIVKQVEYYFGDVNLPFDKFIKTECANNDGWFPAELLLKFNKLMVILSEIPEADRLKTILDALKGSTIVEIKDDLKFIRRNTEIPLPEGNSQDKTIYLKGFNKTDTKIETLIDHFKKYDGFAAVIMRHYKEKLIAPPEAVASSDSNRASSAPPKLDQVIFVKKFKGSIFVVFQTEEQAKAALQQITTYANNPLIKMMQSDYLELKKKEYMERLENRKGMKRKPEEQKDDEEKKVKVQEDEAEPEEEQLKGVLLRFSGIPEGTFRETIKQQWYVAVEDKERFEIGYIDQAKGADEAIVRLKNEGAATEALGLDVLKDGTFLLKEGVSLKVTSFGTEEEEKAQLLKMQEDRKASATVNANRRGFGGRGRGRGRGGRRRGGRGRRR